MNKNIAILTFHDAINYGAFLQCFALNKIISDLNYNVKVLNYKNKFFQTGYSQRILNKKTSKEKILQIYHWVVKPIYTFNLVLKNHKFKKCQKKYLKLSKLYFKNNIKNSNDEFDTFIVGSDQVWNYRISGFDDTYFLNFVKDNNTRISYAASIGKKYLTGEEYYLLKENLPKFKAISVREKSTVIEIKDKLNYDVRVVLDPTLLLGRDEWLKITPNFNKKKKYIFIYLVQTPTYLLNVAFDYAKKNNLQVYSFSKLRTKNKYKLFVNKSPIDFLNFINSAEKIFTTSYHGILFSINFHKDFYYELSTAKINMNERIEDIMKNFKIEGREINSTNQELVTSAIDYKFVDEVLEIERDVSKKFLIDAIGGK